MSEHSRPELAGQLMKVQVGFRRTSLKGPKRGPWDGYAGRTQNLNEQSERRSHERTHTPALGWERSNRETTRDGHESTPPAPKRLGVSKHRSKETLPDRGSFVIRVRFKSIFLANYVLSGGVQLSSCRCCFAKFKTLPS